MPAKFTTRPRQIGRWCSELDEEIADLPHLTIFENRDAEDTGLLDAKGNPLYRVSEAEPIGFLPPCKSD